MQQIEKLLSIMARLRDPENGCPWDQQQTFASIAPYTIEEAYEVADAIERNDLDALCDELGDLLLQIVFHSQLAEEQNAFSFSDIVTAICEKMIRRHPHVFGSTQYRDQGQHRAAWEQIKAAERQRLNKNRVLDGIPNNLPSLSRADKIQRRAAGVGFDWPDSKPVYDKVIEELDEVRSAQEIFIAAEEHDAAADDPAADKEQLKNQISEEIGDLLFTCVNLARHLHINPEAALRQSNHKFEQRFNWLEQQLAASRDTFEQKTLAQLDELWNQAKQAIASAPSSRLNKQ